MTSPAGAAPVTPKRLQKLQVLYLFSGAPRRADIASCLHGLVNEFNTSAEFTFVIDLEMEEVDIERGGRSHDLLDPVRRKRYMELAGSFGIALYTPPCNTHSRSLHSGIPGPPPVRDALHPRGFLDLSPEMKKKAEAANILMDFSIDMLRASGEAGVISFLEFPEDLGMAPLGRPASIWQRSDLKLLESLGYRRAALYQDQWSDVGYRKPTGIFCNAPRLHEEANIYMGWPSFDAEGRYVGPLPDRPPAEKALIGKRC